ncbi:MAG: universal stress protein [Cyclobacteriaceae bacterium]
MRRILVPTDFSKLSEHALSFAAHIAKNIGAEVSIIHLEDLPLGDTSLHLTGEAKKSGFTEDVLFEAQLLRTNKTKLIELSEKYTKDGVVVTGQQFGGGFLKGIEHYVEKNGADLIVMGTTGEESIQELFSGNHTEQLIEHLDVPVLSIQHEVDKNIKDIVLGLDLLDEKYTKKAFPMIKILSESLDAHVHVINVVTDGEPLSLMSDLNKLARGVGLKNYVVDVIRSKNENEALMDFADQVRAGLIITLSEARSGLYRFFQHSFATKMTKTSSIPVLTINKRNT